MTGFRDQNAYFETLDPCDSEIAPEIVRVFAPRAAALVAFVDPQPAAERQAVLECTLAGALCSGERFDPAFDPSFAAWFYGRFCACLLDSLPLRRRYSLRRQLPAVLAALPHRLSAVEIAAALNLRESRVLHNAGPALEAHGEGDGNSDGADRGPVEFDMEALQQGVARRLRTGGGARNKRRRKQAPLQETLWAIAVLGAILAAFLAFGNDRRESPPPALFPTGTPALPALLTTGNTNVRTAPVQGASEQQEPGITINLEPRLSKDGRFVIFSSNSSRLVPGDGNETYDIFVYDVARAAMNRVSLAPDGSELEGDSFAPDISADGSRIVFAYMSPQGELDIYLSDWQSGSPVRIDRFEDGRFNPAALAPAISGDGNTAIYWASPDLDSLDSDCGEAEDIGNCVDLFVYEVQESRTTRIPMAIQLYDFLSYANLSGDGSLVTMTLYPRDRAWSRLGSDNGSEAVLYDWRADTFIPLNVRPDGAFGEGGSLKPVVSASGRYAAFISTAGDITPGDDNSRDDVFLMDLDNGSLQRISLTPDGRRDEGEESPGLLPPDWGELLDISSDGRFVIYIADVSEDLGGKFSAFCNPLDEPPLSCYSLYLYDRLEDLSRVIDITLLPRLESSRFFIIAPSIDDRGARIALLSIAGVFDQSNSQQAHCPPEGCFSVWLLNSTGGENRLVSRELPESTGETGWVFLRNLPAPDGWVNEVAVDPTGRYVASASNDGAVLLTDIRSGENLFTFREHSREASSVAISPDGRLLASGARDGLVLVHDMADGELVAQLLDQPGILFDLAFSPDSRSLAVGSQQALWVWQAGEDGFRLEESHAQRVVNAVAYSPDGKWLASSSSDEVWLRDSGSGEVVLRLADFSRRILDLAFSPVAGGPWILAAASEDGSVRVYRLEEGGGGLEAQALLELKHSDWASAVAFSPDGTILATGSFDNSIHLWSFPEGQYIQGLQRSRQDQILSLAFTPGGVMIVSGTVRGIRVWRLIR